MANSCRRDAETTAADAAQAVTRKREHEPFGCAAALLGNGPTADFGVPQLLAARPLELGLDALPQLAAPLGRTRKRRMANPQIIHSDRA